MRLCRLLLILAVIASGLTLLALASRQPVLAVIVAVLVVGTTARKRRVLTAYGTAVWADLATMRKANCLSPGPGLGVGYVRAEPPRLMAALDSLLHRRVPAREACEAVLDALRGLPPWKALAEVRLNSAIHLSVFAPTGVGKGVSLILPFLLRCTQSVCVYDPKGEAATICGPGLRARGFRVVTLDPYRVVVRPPEAPDRLNPLDQIGGADDPLALDRCRALAEEVVIKTGTEPDPHWVTTATNVVAAGLAVVCLLPPGPNRSLDGCRQLLSSADRFRRMVEMMLGSDAWGGMLARMGHVLSHLKDKELASVLSTMNRAMTFLDTVPIAEATSASTFDPRSLTRGRVAVFVVLPPEQMKAQAGYLRLVIGSLIRACMAGGLQETNTVTFLLDESSSLGQMNILEETLAIGRGYSIRLHFYYQSLGQLKTVWRDGLDQSLLSNTTQVYFGINDHATAEHVSNLLGDYTEVVQNEGDSRGSSASQNTQDPSGNTGTNRGTNRSWQQIQKKLLQPAELLRLPKETAITILPGCPPLCTHLVPYYQSVPAMTRLQAMRTTAAVWVLAVVAVSAALAVGYAAISR